MHLLRPFEMMEVSGVGRLRALQVRAQTRHALAIGQRKRGVDQQQRGRAASDQRIGVRLEAAPETRLAHVRWSCQDARNEALRALGCVAVEGAARRELARGGLRVGRRQPRG
jgi:hypothetical protein